MSIHMRHMMTVLVLFSCLMLPAQAHGPLDAVPEAFEPGEPFDGAGAFALMLEQNARALLTGEQLQTIARIGRMHREGEQDAQSTDPTLRGPGRRKVAYSEQLLLELASDIEPRLEADLNSGQIQMDYSHFAPLPERNGLALMRVSFKEGGVRFRTVEIDMNNFDKFFHGVDVPFGPGTTWVLFHVKRAPVGKNMNNLVFTLEGDPNVRIPGHLLVDAPPLGRLDVTIRNENGELTPALARLVSVRTGRLLKPGSAVDYSDQMDKAGLFDLPAQTFHWTNVPGPLGGLYWCVPEPFDMAISPGQWELHVRHGLEHKSISQSFTVVEGQTTTLEIRLERWADMAARGWYAGDDHVHSRVINQQDADQLLAWAKAEGIHVVNVLKMGDHMRTHFEQRAFGKMGRVQDGDYVIVPGQEDPRYVMGHAIGLNLTSMVRDVSKYLFNDWAADEIHRQGGLYGFAHLATNLFAIERDMTMLVPRGKADFGEILQFRTLGTDLYYDFLDLGYPLTASAGSDVPYGSALGEVRVYAHCGKRFDVDKWFDAMKAGRTFVTNGPLLELDVDGEMPGATITVQEDRRLTVKARAWGLPDASAPATLQLVQHGKVIASVQPKDGETGLQIEAEVNAGHGFWITAHAVAYDGTEALATPVYVVREGYRFWNTERVEDLLADRYATLDEIQQILVGTRESAARNEIAEADVYNRLLAQQAGAGLERVELVRGLYEELGRQYKDEMTRRELVRNSDS